MPVILDTAELRIGDYYRNIRTGVIVEIMRIDLSGNCQVLDILAPLDAPWQRLTESQISSAPWQRIQRT